MSACATTDGDCGTGAHLCIPKGGTKTATFYYRENDQITPIDITGMQARMRIAAYAGANLFTFTSDPAAGLTITDPTLGRIDWKMTPAQTGTLTAGAKLEWQLELYNPLDVTAIKRFPLGTADVTEPVP